MTLRNPSRRSTTSLTAILISAWLLVAMPMTAAAAVGDPVDFGNVNVGETLTLDYELPLTYSLSQLPPDIILYSGGDPATDFLLTQVGLTAPVTAGSLFSVTGEITADYILMLSMSTGTDFSVSTLDCGTPGTSCTVSVTFLPTAQGPLSDSVRAHPSNVNVTGGGTFGALVDLFAPFLAAQVESQLVAPVTGYGATPSGGLELRVSVPREAAPCVLLGATSIDFGTLPFSTEAALSEGSLFVDVTSCSTGSQALYASGTDATGSGATPANWALSAAGGNPCTFGVNQYGVALGTDGSGGMPAAFQLSTLSSSWIVMSAGSELASSVDYQMPCVGSAGAGQTMSSQVTFLATVP